MGSLPAEQPLRSSGFSCCGAVNVQEGAEKSCNDAQVSHGEYLIKIRAPLQRNRGTFLDEPSRLADCREDTCRIVIAGVRELKRFGRAGRIDTGEASLDRR